jgi:hypothetical protein
MSTQVGSSTGQCGGTESLPEVQESVLEQAEKEEAPKWRLSDPHPDFPLLYVDRLNDDGSVYSWGTRGAYFSLDDPRIVVLDRAGRQLQRHLKSKVVVDGILGKLARPRVGKRILSA